MNAVIAAACVHEESCVDVWSNVPRAIDSVWDHLSRMINEFETGDHKRIAAKVIDGDKLLAGKELP